MKGYYGYIRADGKVGVRNHLLVIPVSACAAEVSARIASHVEEARFLPNQHGCCQIGADLSMTQNTLIGMGKNPNVGGVLVVSLGCESISAGKVVDEIERPRPPATDFAGRL